METAKQISAVPHTTHTVFNQPPPLVGYNVFTQDAALIESVLREGASWAQDRVSEIGAFAGREDVIQPLPTLSVPPVSPAIGDEPSEPYPEVLMRQLLLSGRGQN